MKKELFGFIRDYMNEYKKDIITDYWQMPLMGIAAANDPLFLQLKETVSNTHLLPEDLLDNARSVITFFIPFKEEIGKSNVKGKNSSRMWADSYIETNKLINNINKTLDGYLNDLGYQTAVVPATHNFDEEKLISNWSHRHVAYIAGLGKFGLNNMLITEKGCCGRLGSIITNAFFLPDIRPDYEYCLYKSNGKCGICIDKCVNNALEISNFNRYKCYEMCLENDRLYPNNGLADVCGKCLVGIPCSFINPSGLK